MLLQLQDLHAIKDNRHFFFLFTHSCVSQNAEPQSDRIITGNR